MFFANAKRDDVRKENPGITFGMPHLHLMERVVFANCARVPQAKLARNWARDGRR